MLHVYNPTVLQEDSRFFVVSTLLLVFITYFVDILTSIDLQCQHLRIEAASMMKKIELLEVSKRFLA